MSALRLLLADVDGTLVTQAKVVTERAHKAVEQLRAAGIAFAITSGRPPRGLISLAKELDIQTPMAGFNGGVIVRPNLDVIVKRTLPLAVAEEVLDYLEAQGIVVWVYTAFDWFVTTTNVPRMPREQSNVGFQPTVVPDLHAVLDGAVKITGVWDDEPRLAQIESNLRDRVGEFASATRSQSYYLDVTDADANKGNVVHLSSQFLRIPLDQIAVIGDKANDVLMFGVAGTSIAMGNADPEVKRCARYVTTSNEAEGFANAVDWFVLGHRRPPEPQATLGLPSRTRACVFAVDNVFVATAELHAAACQHTLDAYLRAHAQVGAFDPKTDYRTHIDGKSSEDGIRSFLTARGIHATPQSIHDLARHKDDRVLELLHSHRIETDESALRYLRAVREAGLRTAVVCASRWDDDVLASSGIADLFDARIDDHVVTEEHLASRPAPDMLVAACEALGVHPDRAVVFESALSGVEAARAGHFGYVVGVNRNGLADDLRSHGADAVVSNLAAMLEPHITAAPM